jgi:hypothetical protein
MIILFEETTVQYCTKGGIMNYVHYWEGSEKLGVCLPPPVPVRGRRADQAEGLG